MTTKTVSTLRPAYRIAIAQPGCAHCGHGRFYGVEGPDGAMLGQTWAVREQAEWMVTQLNSAYIEGRIAAGAPEH